VTAVEREAREVPDAPSWDRRLDRRAAALLFLVVWVVYLLTATYDEVQINDNRAVNISAWSLGTQGTLALPEDWEGQNRWIVRGADDRVYTNRFPGAILWATPFHAVAEAVLGRGVPDHSIFLNHAPGGVAAATATALAVLATFLVLRRLADRRLAIGATLVVAFATGTWSVSADSMWTHGLTHLTLTLGVLAAASGHNARGGLAFAAAAFTRPQTAVVAAVVGLWRGAHLRSIRPVIVIGLVSALGVVALSAYSYRLFGTLLPVAGYSGSRITAVATTSGSVFGERLLHTLANPRRGVLVYTPFLLVLLPFAWRGWRVSPWWVRASAIAGLVYLVVQLRANTWHGGSGFFGSRLALETVVLAAPLLLRTWQVCVSKVPILRVACLTLVAASFALHTFGALRPVPPNDQRALEVEIEKLCDASPDLEGCPPGGARPATPPGEAVQP
jgi:hypothetical protein